MVETEFRNGSKTIRVKLTVGAEVDEYRLHINVGKKHRRFTITSNDTLIAALSSMTGDIGLKFGRIRDWCNYRMLELEES